MRLFFALLDTFGNHREIQTFKVFVILRRFVVVCGDGEYIIYTAMALRNKAFGSALQFIWNKNDASAYAVRESGTTVKIFKNFKEKATLRPDGGCEAIYAGHLLGVKSSSG